MPAPRPLDGAGVSHAMAVPADPGQAPDFLDLPAGPAVVIFETADGRTVLIATTADARALARRRLVAEPEDGGRGPCVDLRAPIAGGRVAAIAVGSALEADAVYLRQARERLPEVARVVAERWRAWFAHVDPSAEFPVWTKTNLLGLVRVRSAGGVVGAAGPGGPPPGVLLGPIPDKDAAGRFIEAAIDAFDLCRYPHLLAQAPRASACAYKEMGRCPAPCDGSEGMPEYRARTAQAVRSLAAGGPAGSAEEIEREMRGAAAEGAFERAAVLKKSLDRVAALARPAFAHVARLDAWRLVILLPSAAAGRLRVVLADRGRLWLLGDADPGDEGAVGRACGLAGRVMDGPAPALDDAAVDSIGLLTRWLFLPAKRRRGEVVRVGAGLDDAAVLAAARRLARARGAEPAIEAQEIEGA